MRMASSPPRVLAICKTRDRDNLVRAVFILYFIKVTAPSTQNIQKENSCTNAGTRDPLVKCAMLQCQVQIQIQLLGNAQRFNECFMHDEQAVKLGGLYNFDPTHVERFFSWNMPPCVGRSLSIFK